MKEVLIIIPAYNEEKNIESFLEKLEVAHIVDWADLLIINDGSADRTAELVEKRGYSVLSQIYNMGYGSALQTGYKYADIHGYSFFIQMDADGKHDFCNVETLYQKMQEKDADGRTPDIVIGSRFMTGSAEYKIGKIKEFAIHLFSFIIHFSTGKKISDPTSGLQGLNQRVIQFYSKFNNFDDKYPDANMILQMLLLGYKVEEIPAVMHYRQQGVSMHSGLKPILYMIRMCISLLAARLRVHHIKQRNGVKQ